MKRKIYLLPVIILIITGCSVQNKGWENPVPTDFDSYIDTLIVAGWEAYSAGETDISYAKFDSVLSIEAKSSEGYIGRAFSSIDLGSDDPAAYSSSETDFNFALYLLEGKNPVMTEDSMKMVFSKLTADSQYYVLKLPVSGIFLGVYEDIMEVMYTDTIEHTADLSLYYFNDSIVMVPVITRGFIDPADSSLFIPDSNTVFTVHVAYTDVDTLTPMGGSVGAGLSQLYQLKAKKAESEDDIKKYLMTSVSYGNLTRAFYSLSNKVEDYLPSRFDDRINTRNVLKILAQDYYYYGLYMNAYWQIYEIDPGVAAGIDTTAADFDVQLLRAIGSL